jgi:hypothetical protein
MLDVRAQKSNPKAPDFQCPDANCLNDKGYRTGAWLPKGRSAAPAPVLGQPSAIAGPSGGMDVSADALRVELFWDSFDSVMHNIATRKLTDMFKPENICNLVATLYIGRTGRK